MKHTLLALGALALAACGQQTAQTETNETTVAEAPSPAPAPAMTDAEFVQNVVNATAFEVQSSQLAPQHAHAAAVKAFAARMVRDHNAAAQQLDTVLPQLNMAAPAAALDTAMTTQLDSLRAANGAAFDTAYSSAQLQAHQQAVSLFENYAAAAQAGPLKDWANNTLPTLRDHLQMAQALQTPS